MFRTTCTCLALFLALATPAAAQDEKPKPPRATERDGLAVTIRSVRPAFAPGDPLAFEVTFKNVSDEPIRFPDRPQSFNHWEFHLEKVGSKELYTGRCLLPVDRRAKAVASAPLAPRASLSVAVRLDDSFGFAEGPWDAKKAVKQLPEGKYRLRAEILFPNQPRPDRNPARLWQGAPLITRPADFTITTPER